MHAANAPTPGTTSASESIAVCRSEVSATLMPAGATR
jgi:hypothetical protein